MELLTRAIQVEIWNFEDMPQDQRDLILAAVRVRENAQAPYSHYFVGAAIRSESGAIYRGCNVERGSWTQTSHAEQSSVDGMIKVEGPAKMVMMAVVGAPEGQDINLYPDPKLAKKEPEIHDFCFACGHCLQIIWENCMVDPDVILLAVSPWGIGVTRVGDAFPMPFGPEKLGVNVRRRVGE